MACRTQTDNISAGQAAIRAERRAEGENPAAEGPPYVFAPQTCRPRSRGRHHVYTLLEIFGIDFPFFGLSPRRLLALELPRLNPTYPLGVPLLPEGAMGAFFMVLEDECSLV
jgi:hypothetical protein